MKNFRRFISLLFSIFLLSSITPVQAQWELLSGWALISPDYRIRGNDFTVTNSGKVLVVTEWDGMSPHDYGLIVAGRAHSGGGWYLIESRHIHNINFIKGLDNGLVVKHYADYIYAKYDNGNSEIRVSVDDGETYDPELARTGDGGFIASDMIDENNGLALHTYAYPSKSTTNSTNNFPLGHLIRIIDGEAEWIQAYGLFFYDGSIQLVNDTTAYLLSKISSTKNRADNHRLMKSYDFGLSWDTLVKSPEGRLTHFAFASANEGIVTSNNGITYYTLDGGETFIEESIGDTRKINFVVTRGGSYYAAGASGLILKKETIESLWEDISFGSENFVKIQVNHELRGYVLTDDIRLYRSSILLGTTEETASNTISVIPVPASDQITFNIPTLTGKAISIQLFDIQGKSVFKESYSALNSTLTINTSHFNPGTYIYKINDDYQNYTGKFIINR